jgi:hypothetical protein
MKTASFRPIKAALAAMLLASGCWAANALIVQDGTAGIEADALANLTTHLTAATFVVTNSVGVPAGSLATYQQIWDIRFNNTTPLSASDITAYVGYMAAGGSLFVMGENTGFNVRDDSIVSLIANAGGGTITYTTPANLETVHAPFTGPNAIAGNAITYQAAAGTSFPARGVLITTDAAGIGAAIVWAPGRMLNAMNGSLIVVFDVNFLQAGAPDPNMSPFINNLIAFLAAPVNVPGGAPIPLTPAPSTLLLILTGGAAIVAFDLRRRYKRRAV